jgi:chemotaxis protein CheY-P-specific phosphatase CheC
MTTRPAGQYKLRRKYWDGRQVHKVDAVLSFAEGMAPSTAILVAEAKAAAVAAAVIESDEDDDESEDDEPVKKTEVVGTKPSAAAAKK